MSIKRKYYDDDFKKQIVNNIQNQSNHTYRSLSKEYDMAIYTIRQRVVRYNSTKSFDAEGNRTDEEKRLIELEKKVYLGLAIIINIQQN